VDEGLPELYMPIGIGGVLPHNLIYYSVKNIDRFKPKLVMNQKKQREDICSNNLKED
jgi:hypothetical protein